MAGKTKFIVGAVAGASALLAAVPFLAQMSNAASSGSSVSSVTVQQKADAPDAEVPDAQEAAAAAAQAKITADTAAATALQAQPGQVKGSTLDSENGTVAYKVEISNAGKDYDVLVDAVSGKVLSSHEDGKDGNGHHDDANEADEHGTEVNDGPDQANANEAAEAPGQSDQNEQETVTPAAAASSSL
jgi:uncharacterized membrane protein YkoI